MAGKIKLKSLNKQSLLGEAVNAMQKGILAGDYETDGFLPSEGTLADQLAVSRTVIREAMRVLESRGLVEISQGRRPRVRAGDAGAVSATLDVFIQQSDHNLLDLVEVRRALECEAVRLAAKRAKQEQIEEMENAIDALREPNINVNKMIDLDIRFHELLAESTGNVLFKVLLAPLTELLKESHRKTLKVSGIKASITSHEKVLNAIKRHSPADARKAMNKKLDATANDIRKAEGQ